MYFPDDDIFVHSEEEITTSKTPGTTKISSETTTQWKIVFPSE